MDKPVKCNVLDVKSLNFYAAETVLSLRLNLYHGMELSYPFNFGS